MLREGATKSNRESFILDLENKRGNGKKIKEGKQSPMIKMNYSKVNERFEDLKGAQLISFGRAAAMTWIRFKKCEKEYFLHIQCYFRVTDNTDVLVMNTEMFEPSDLVLNSGAFDIDTFDWDKQGQNKYDEWADNLAPRLINNLVVKDVQISVYGDLRVYLANNITIEVIGDSMARECWRFFERGVDQHIVMIGCDIEVDG